MRMSLKFHESMWYISYFTLELQWRVFLEMVNCKLLQAIDFRKWFQLGKHVAWNSTTNFDDTISFDILKPIPRPFTFARHVHHAIWRDFARKVPNRVWTNVEKTGVLKDPERPLMPGSCRSLLCGLTNSLHRTIHVLQLHPFELKPPACPRIAVRGNWLASGDLDGASIDMEQQRMKSHRSRLADDASLARVDCSKRINHSCQNGEYSNICCTQHLATCQILSYRVCTWEGTLR